MKKIISTSIFIFCLSGTIFSQTKVFSFENEKQPERKPIPFGLSVSLGMGGVGNKWGNIVAGGVSARVHFSLLTAEAFFSGGSSSIKFYPYESHEFYRITTHSDKFNAATIGLGCFTKYVSCSMGVGPGSVSTYHSFYVKNPNSEHADVTDYKSEMKNENVLCSSIHLTVHGKGVGFTFQYLNFSSKSMTSYSFMFGIEFGLLRSIKRN